MSKPDDEKDVRDPEVVKKGRNDRAWTLTDALVEAFTLGFETAKEKSHKDADDALDDDDVSDRLGRIHEKFGADAIRLVEDILDLEAEE